MQAEAASDEHEAATQTRAVGYWGSLRAELSSPWFSVDDFNGKAIDFKRSFSPDPKGAVIAFKVVVTLWTFQVALAEIMQGGTFFLDFMFATQWIFLLTLLYLPASLGLSLFDVAKQPPPSAEKPNLPVCFTWAFFPTVASAQIFVSVLFWLLVYDARVHGSPPYYPIIMKHGILMVLLLVEGLCVNKVPIKLKHFVFVLIIACLFGVWTVVHSALDIGNPSREGTGANDQVLYDIVDWKDKPLSTFIVATISVFVVLPFMYFSLWTASLWGRRYLDDNADPQHKKFPEP